MFLSKEVKLPGGGSFTFQGEVSEEDLEFIIEEGLLSLLSQGALPFVFDIDPAQVSSDFEADTEFHKLVDGFEEEDD